MSAVHIIVYGKVQGVCYRASTQETAEGLKLAGWTRNCSDGTVEIHAEGEKSQLEKLIAWCHKGPPLAKVSRVAVDWVPSAQLRSFEVRG
ncbi:MAG: acylphosphatase [Nitrospinae bacterium RIFCSPLOWO2_12_FULL_47_7]|nr:MAG: acylphosphatase [Nitrospinae bacterium RIFCSPLOWO2_12_FULL_47_7]